MSSQFYSEWRASFSLFCSAICGLGQNVQLGLVRASKQKSEKVVTECKWLG
jgi:hypothetical protein